MSSPTVQFDSNKFIPPQRKELEEKINKILDDFLEPLMNSTIVEEIKSLAKASNLPQGFIDGVKFRRTEPNKGEIINTWGSKEKPLALWFNDGTKSHWIAPVKAKALHWLSKVGIHPQAIFFRGGTKAGTNLFSKGHYVSGIVATHAMERGYSIGKKRLAIESGKLVERELNE